MEKLSSSKRTITACRVSASGRIDVAGGWSDTPPITLEFGGAVVNIAIRVDNRVWK